MKKIVACILLSFTLFFSFTSTARAVNNFSIVTSTATETTIEVTVKAAAPLEVNGATIYLKQGMQLIQYSTAYNQLAGNNTLKKTFTGLTKATTYEVHVEWMNTSLEKQPPELLGTITTKGTVAAPGRPTVPVAAATPVTEESLTLEALSTSIGAHTTFLGTKTKTYSVVYYLADNNTMLQPTTKQADAIFNTQDSKFYSGATFTGLSPGKTYYVQAEIFDGAVGKKTAVQTAATKPPAIVPSGSTYIPRDTSYDLKGYTVLAPIPGFPTIFPSADNCAAHPEMTYCNFGDFLNLVIELAIALAAVMLVIKLVIHGYSYMTQDVPFIKLQAKTKIGESIIGILLALTAYLLLNTINPRLVNNQVGLQKAVLQTLEEDREDDPGNTIVQDIVSVPKGTVAACKNGIEKVQTKGGVFYACTSIAKNLQTMIDLAYAQNIKLGGGGFRTNEQQKVLRAKHCGGTVNIFNEKAKCVPPTAYPGRSRHESGLAFDFTCERQTIRSKDNKCFVWLKNNAKNYALFNFPKEPWHWSIDGK
ncbi:MAG TPA: M15 family metallopeptidase [Candidatus Paceibacterota bacterium]|nr:M15 family metallopeptidase [Candidatus Paceibacterota bacterium]